MIKAEDCFDVDEMRQVLQSIFVTKRKKFTKKQVNKQVERYKKGLHSVNVELKGGE